MNIRKPSSYIITLLYSVILLSLFFYSFVLVDPNITFVNHHYWEVFRNYVVQIGYYERPLSWNIYFALIILLTSFHIFFYHNYKRYNPLTIAGIVSVVLLLAYPFLSHDLFNYMFDARMLTHYGSNPYTHKALDFGADPWLRFMHWTHRTYPYGPSFLAITLIPSFLSFGKFVLSYIFFKLLFVGLYFLSVWTLHKKNQQWAMFFATQPLVIIEGIVNAHNDLVAVGLALLGITYIAQKPLKRWWGRLLLLLSGGIKYFSLPTIILPGKATGVFIPFVTMASSMAPIVYISITGEIQPWYYLNILIFLPFFFDYIKRLHIFFFGLLMSYYPFIALGGWAKGEHTVMKHQIIMLACIAQVVYLVVIYRKRIFFKK